MIDLHFHCLPGIDDGPLEWAGSVALCRAAAAQGVTTIVATPHVLRDPWLNESAAERAALVSELNRRLGGTPQVVPGCEYYFSSDALELCQMRDSSLTMLGGKSYLLTEFPATRLPESAAAVFHELKIVGITPVIAHPERNLVLARQPEKLERLIEVGAVTQVTAGSLIGEFGKAALAAAEDFLERGLVHVIASDAHSVERRPPRMSEARAWLAEEWSEEIAQLLCEVNPARVLAGEPIA